MHSVTTLSKIQELLLSFILQRLQNTVHCSTSFKRQPTVENTEFKTEWWNMSRISAETIWKHIDKSEQNIYNTMTLWTNACYTSLYRGVTATVPASNNQSVALSCFCDVLIQLPYVLYIYLSLLHVPHAPVAMRSVRYQGHSGFRVMLHFSELVRADVCSPVASPLFTQSQVAVCSPLCEYSLKRPPPQKRIIYNKKSSCSSSSSDQVISEQWLCLN